MTTPDVAFRVRFRGRPGEEQGDNGLHACTREPPMLDRTHVACAQLELALPLKGFATPCRGIGRRAR
jgi:hypothetical protein